MDFFVWQRTCVDEAGNVLPSASVTVTDVVSGELAQLYSDPAGSVGIGNPITADSEGFVQFYVKSGFYNITATSGSRSRTWNREAIGAPHPRTAAEISAGVTPVDFRYEFGRGERWGSDDALLAAIIAVAGEVDELTVTITEPVKASANATIPSNVTLRFLHGGYLAPDSGVTLTLNCAIDAPLRQIFAGEGDFDLTGCVTDTHALEWFGAVRGSDASDALDKACDTFWTSHESRFTLEFPSDVELDKDGDFHIPPNLKIVGRVGKTRLRYGHANTRIVLKRDNSRVGPSYQGTGDDGYWGLGENVVAGFEVLPKDGVVVEECFLVSNLIRTKFIDVSCAVRSQIKVGVHMQNTDGLWTEKWSFTRFRADCSVAGVKFTTNGGSASFGHGSFTDCDINARASLSSGLLITDGASPYHMTFENVGFVENPEATGEAAMIRITNGGTLRYATFRCRIETIGANNVGAVYAIWGDEPDLVRFCGGEFRGISSAFRFRGCYDRNEIYVHGGRLVLSDGETQPTNGNELYKRVIGRTDANGDNLMTAAHLKTLRYVVPGTISAGDVIGHLPRNVDRQRIIYAQINAGTAPAGNTGGVWYFGIRRAGATNPTRHFTIEDGETEAFNEVFYLVPSTWYDDDGNHIVARSEDGSGNDGTGPSDIELILSYVE